MTHKKLGERGEVRSTARETLPGRGVLIDRYDIDIKAFRRARERLLCAIEYRKRSDDVDAGDVDLRNAVAAIDKAIAAFLIIRK